MRLNVRLVMAASLNVVFCLFATGVKAQSLPSFGDCNLNFAAFPPTYSLMPVEQCGTRVASGISGLYSQTYFPDIYNAIITRYPSPYCHIWGDALWINVTPGTAFTVYTETGVGYFVTGQSLTVAYGQAVLFVHADCPGFQGGVNGEFDYLVPWTGPPQTPPIELSTGNINISASSETIGPDDIITVQAGTPVQFGVPVSALNTTGYSTVDTSVNFQPGQEPDQNQSVTLSSSLGFSELVPFYVTFSSADIGIQTITATVDPNNSYGGSNKTSTMQIRVTQGDTIAVTEAHFEQSVSTITR